MKRFLFLALLPMLLVGCEPNNPNNNDDIENPYFCPKPSLWSVYTAHNGSSYRAPQLSARFRYEHPVGVEKKWEKLCFYFLCDQGVFPNAWGLKDVFVYDESPYPDTPKIVITKEDYEYELYKEFATTAQLFHLAEQLTDDENTNVYIHAEVVDVIITADVPLFGREAGSNLVDKFGIMGFYELVDFATYDVLDAEIKLQTADKIKKTLF